MTERHSDVERSLHLSRRTAGLLSSVLLAASCSDSPAGPSSEGIEVRSTSPAPGTMLAAGSRVTITYTVACNLVSADSAVVALSFANQVGTTLDITQADTPIVTSIGRGRTTVTLTGTVLIPAGSSRMTVLVAMQYPGSFGQHEREFRYPVQ